MGKMKCNDIVSQDYYYLYVNIIQYYLCLVLNHQVQQIGVPLLLCGSYEGPVMCTKMKDK